MNEFVYIILSLLKKWSETAEFRTLLPIWEMAVHLQMGALCVLQHCCC